MTNTLRPPEPLEVVKQALRLADAIKVSPNHPLATSRFFGHKHRLVQNGNVFLDCREGHLVGARLLQAHLSYEYKPLF